MTEFKSIDLHNIREDAIETIHGMLNHWYNPNKKEALIEAKLIEGKLYHVTYQDLLFEIEDGDGLLLLDRLMTTLLFHPQCVVVLDDLFGMSSMQALVKNRYVQFAYRYSVPVESDAKIHAKKVVTLTANLKHEFLRFDMSSCPEEDRWVLLQEYLNATKDFYPKQIVDNLKALFMLFRGDVLAWEKLHEDDRMLDDPHGFIQYLFQSDLFQQWCNLSMFIESLPLSMMMFEEGRTLDSCAVVFGKSVMEFNDPFAPEQKVPSIVQFFLDDTEFIDDVLNSDVCRDSIVMYYFLSENKDYIFSGKNLFRLLTDNGYYQNFLKSTTASEI